jgi:DNA-binding NarL/FixJ family response regulator
MCLKCGTWTEVLDTRIAKDGMTTSRRRECANGHRFRSIEIYAPVFSSAKQRQATFAETVLRRRALHARNEIIRRRLAAGEQGKDIAADLNVSTSTVSLVARGKACL